MSLQALGACISGVCFILSNIMPIGMQMGYEVKIRKNAQGGRYWVLNFREVKGNKKLDTFIRKDSLQVHGFHPSMDIEDAKERARQLNALKKIEKREEKKKVRILAQAREREEIKSAHLPLGYLDSFENEFLKDHLAVGANALIKYRKTLFHWQYAKRMILSLQIPVEDFNFRAAAFYEYFRTQSISFGYCKKVLRVINLWGVFLSRRTGIRYVPIPPPKGREREAINDAWHDSGNRSKTSEPLSPSELESAKERLKPEQYRWLYVSIWFGLRSHEIDCLHKPKFFHTDIDEQGTTILYVYQPKLVAIPRADRFKPIPILYPEQLIALNYVREGNLKRPLPKTLQKYIKPGLNTYGGRKGFTDLMRGRGQAIEDISVWMGHQDISTTWSHYKNKKKATYKKPA